MTFWSDISPYAVLKRWAGRVSIGAGSVVSGGYFPPRWPWSDSADWAGRDAQALVMATDGNMAVVGASRTSDDTGTNGAADLSGHAAIGISGFLINDKEDGRGWAGYFDVQHEADALWSAGIEFASKNKGADVTATPYSPGNGVVDIWAQGGGDPTYGGEAANPTKAWAHLVKNGSTYNTAIVIDHEALTGDYGTVLAMAQGHQLVWYTPDNGIGASIRSDVSAAGHKVTMVFGNDGIDFYGDNGQIVFAVRHVASGVNQVLFSNAATGSPPSLAASGPDANIDLALCPKGIGRLKFGARVAHADAAITGYIEVKDSGGTLRKLAVIA